MVLPVDILARLRRQVGIEGGVACQRQNLSAVRVHHHHAAAGRVVGFHGHGDLPLGDELQPLVESECDWQAGMRFGIELGVDAAPIHVGEEPGVTGPAAQVRIQRLLDPGVALLLKIDRPEHLRRQRAIRIMPLALALDSDPLQTQLAQALPFVKTDLALDPQKSAAVLVGPLHLPVQVGLVQVQHQCQNLGGHPQVRNLQRVHVHRFGGNAHGQRLAVAIEDGAARSRNFQVQFLPVARQPDVLLVVQNLQREQLCENSRAPDEEQCCQDCEAPLDHRDRKSKRSTSPWPRFHLVSPPGAPPARKPG
jgi:hypothetical protein